MTPQQKATELVEKYRTCCYPPYFIKEDAKALALLAVEDIIKANPIIPLTCMLESEAIDAAIEYWNEVKAEIEKL